MYFIFKLLIFSIIGSDTLSHNLHKIIESENFYQITTFISENFTKNLLGETLFHKTPNTLYLFGANRKNLYDDTDENYYISEFNKTYMSSYGNITDEYPDAEFLENIENSIKVAILMKMKKKYSLQESLVTFYTSDLNEIKSFIDFLVRQLTVRQRPKCLIVYSRNINYNHRTDLKNILKYAWDKKFLDFTVAVADHEDSACQIHIYDPFYNVVHEKELTGGIHLFPNKLRNANGYPFIIDDDISSKVNNVHKYWSNHRYEVQFSDIFTINFAARLMNLSMMRISFQDELMKNPSLFDDIFENTNMSIQIPSAYIKLEYSDVFVIPADKQSEEATVAIVPILYLSQMDIFLKISCLASTMTGLVFTFTYLFRCFKMPVDEIEMFDMVRVLLGQSVKFRFQKMLLKTVFLTVVIASVKITNDFLLDMISKHFERGEKPFDTYEDLYKSELKLYHTNEYSYRSDYSRDPYYSKIMDESKPGYLGKFHTNITHCIDMLIKWKNVACLAPETTANVITSKFKNSDGSPVMKIAHPPFSGGDLMSYYFTNGSPFALKFLEIMRRVKETNLMYWPALVDENREIQNVDFTETENHDGIETLHLVYILSFGIFISSITFIFELITIVVKKKIMKYFLKRYLIL